MGNPSAHRPGSASSPKIPPAHDLPNWHQESVPVQGNLRGDPPNVQQYFEALHQELQKTILQEKVWNQETKVGSDVFDRAFWEQVGGLPRYLGRLGDALQMTHELFVEHDVYRYAMIGMVILVGLNREDSTKSLPEKYSSELRGVATKASGKIENCTKDIWDRIFDPDDEVEDGSEGVFSFTDKKSPEWILNKKIDLNDTQYRVMVSAQGDIKVNDRIWHLKDADNSRNADITVSAIQFDPQVGLHFKIKGEVFLFSKEVSKDLNLEQTAALLNRLATAEQDPTPQEIRAAGVELAPGRKNA